MLEKLYRYEDQPDGSGGAQVYLLEFKITKRTAKGAWIDVYGKRRFVLNEGRKRYGYPTEKEAVASFIARKNMQLKYLARGISQAEDALRQARAGEFTPEYALFSL
jgi:hypothetical protein